MRYPVQRAGCLSAKMRVVQWLAKGRKEGRKNGRTDGRTEQTGETRGDPLLVGEIRSSGIMEFLPPLEARHWRGRSRSPVEDLENKTGSTGKRWISINVDPALPVPPPRSVLFSSRMDLHRRHRHRLRSRNAKRELTSNSSRAKFNYGVSTLAREHISFSFLSFFHPPLMAARCTDVYIYTREDEARSGYYIFIQPRSCKFILRIQRPSCCASNNLDFKYFAISNSCIYRSAFFQQLPATLHGLPLNKYTEWLLMDELTVISVIEFNLGIFSWRLPARVQSIWIAFLRNRYQDDCATMIFFAVTGNRGCTPIASADLLYARIYPHNASIVYNRCVREKFVAISFTSYNPSTIPNNAMFFGLWFPMKFARQ